MPSAYESEDEGWDEFRAKTKKADPLFDVIYRVPGENHNRQSAEQMAGAVRAAGYKSPEEIAAALVAALATPVLSADSQDAVEDTVEYLRATLLGGNS